MMKAGFSKAYSISDIFPAANRKSYVFFVSAILPVSVRARVLAHEQKRKIVHL